MARAPGRRRRATHGACCAARRRRLEALRARPRSRPRSRPTWTRCERDGRRSPSSSSATARDVTGGSESLARAVAERLAARLSHHRLHDLRARLRDLAQRAARGDRGVGGVRVRRFVRSRRSATSTPSTASRTSRSTAGRTRRRGRARLAAPPGTVRAASGRGASQRERDRLPCRRVLHVPLLPDRRGLAAAAAARSVLVPTTHDEPPLRFRHLRRGVRASARVRLPDPGRGGARSVPLRSPWPAIRGRGHGRGHSAAAGHRGLPAHATRSPRRTLLYAGRIDAGKGCAELVARYARYRARGGAPRTWSSSGPWPWPCRLCPACGTSATCPRTRSARRWRALPWSCAQARTRACPSRCLEGFAVGTPGLVNAASAVLKEHCLRSNAGLFYGDGDEFGEAARA